MKSYVEDDDYGILAVTCLLSWHHLPSSIASIALFIYHLLVIVVALLEIRVLNAIGVHPIC